MTRYFSFHVLAFLLALVCDSTANSAVIHPPVKDSDLKSLPLELDGIICGLNNHDVGAPASTIADETIWKADTLRRPRHSESESQCPLRLESKSCPLNNVTHVGLDFGGHGCCVKERNPSSERMDISSGFGGPDFILTTPTFLADNNNILSMNDHPPSLYIGGVSSLEAPPPRR